MRKKLALLIIFFAGSIGCFGQSSIIDSAWLLTGNNVTSGQSIGSTNNSDLRFKTNGVERMSIDAHNGSLLFNRTGWKDTIFTFTNSAFSLSSRLLSSEGGNALKYSGRGFQTNIINDWNNSNYFSDWRGHIFTNDGTTPVVGINLSGQLIAGNIASVNYGNYKLQVDGDSYFNGGLHLGNGTSTPHASSILDITSTTKGFLPPRMTATQRLAISSPATSLFVWDTDSSRYMGYNGTGWKGLKWTDEGGLTNVATGHVMFSNAGVTTGNSNFTWNNSNSLLTVNGTISSPGTGLNSEHFGLNSLSGGENSTAIGSGASASGLNSTAIGRNSNTANSGAIAFGMGATVTGDNSLGLGSYVTASGGYANAIGIASTASGDNSLAIGGFANAGHERTIVLGRNAKSTASGQFVVGDNGLPLTSAYFGQGVLSTNPGDFTIQGSGGSGTNITGGNFIIAGSRATGNAAGGDISFATSDITSPGTSLQSLTTKMILKASGNIGIGTITPDTKLHVTGNFKLVDGTQGAGKVLTSDANGLASWQTPAGAGSNNLWTDAGSGNLYNTTLSGNIGIGTTTPASKLDVKGTTMIAGNADEVQLKVVANSTQNSDLFRTVGANGYTNFRITKDGNAVWVANGMDAFTTPSAAFQPYVGWDGTNVAWGNPNQQIMIGAIHSGYSPKPNIQLNGYGTTVNTTFGATFNVINPPSGFGNAAGLVMAVRGTNGQTANLQQWQNDGGAALSSVTSDGRFLIGTTQDLTDYKLAVGGNIIAEKVKVKLQSAGWPDYVFTSTYKLPTLKEVEDFIKANNHLPDVPSAKEIEKNGLDLGDGQAVLLKKIEEMTLYMIEMDKKMKEMDKRIDKLTAENEMLKKQK